MTEKNNYLNIQSLLELSLYPSTTEEVISTGQIVDFTPLNAPSKRLDVYQASMAVNTPIIIFESNGQDNQKWEIVFIRGYTDPFFKALHSNKYMGVIDGRTDAEAMIVQQDLFLGDARQRWTTAAVDNDPRRQIVQNLKSNLVLDVKGANSSDETPLIQFPRNLQLNQQFAIRVV